MPFTSYYNTKPEDIRALYAYFRYGVAPASIPNRASDIPFPPLSMRWPLTYWRWLFASKKPAPYSPRPAGLDRAQAQGAYFVDGLGHCGGMPHTSKRIHAAESRRANRRGTISQRRCHRELLRSEPPKRWSRLAQRPGARPIWRNFSKPARTHAVSRLGRCRTSSSTAHSTCRRPMR